MLTINMSMFGKQYTGMGIYSMHCREEIKKRFHCQEILAKSNCNMDTDNNGIMSPNCITTGKSKVASIYRLLYLSSLPYRYNLGLVYTPTHHGIPNYTHQIITIHDLISIHYPEQHYFQYLYFKDILPKIINCCNAVIAVSKTTKEEVCHYYHLSDDFVHVVPNALENTDLIDQVEDKNYLLSVGAGYKHKNIDELLRNEDIWSGKYSLKIVSASGEYRKYLESIVKEKKLSDCVSIEGFISKSKLDQYYRNCTALVYPSKWEGFGIPPMEAMRYQKPIILSNIKIFKEVFEDSAIYVDLGNIESWRKAFSNLEIVKIKEKRQKYRQILSKYDWTKNGNKLREIIYGIDKNVNMI